MIKYTYDKNQITDKTFANDQKMVYTYDHYGNLETKKSRNGYMYDSTQFAYYYTSLGDLSYLTFNGITKTYTDYSKTQFTESTQGGGYNYYVKKNIKTVTTRN